MPRRPALPAVDADGALLSLTGAHARSAVLVAFEMIGGVERLADWADENPSDFFTKVFPKTITRSEEVHHTAGVEEELGRLDLLDAEIGEMDAIDAEFEVVDVADE